MRISRQLLILTLLTAALCGGREAALAGTSAERQNVPTQGLIRRLSAQLRTVMHARKLQIPPAVSFQSPVARIGSIDNSSACTATLQCWLLNLPPPAC